MGLFDWLFGKQDCPYCGAKDARRTDQGVRCPNPQCQYFDPKLRKTGWSATHASSCPDCGANATVTAGVVRCANPSCRNFDPSIERAGTLRDAGKGFPRTGDFTPAKPLSIRYENFRGEIKTFVADADSVQRRRNHILVRVAPTGEKITLARNRIRNLEEVESVMPQKVGPGQPWPTPRERQVLNYHKKYGTTSPLCEQIRAKYPDW